MSKCDACPNDNAILHYSHGTPVVYLCTTCTKGKSMDHYDRLGNNVDLANSDEGCEDEGYTPTLPEDEVGFDPQREAMEDEWGAQFGDARRCPKHPHVKTSSDDGMFDCDCGECEYESEMAYQQMKQDECPDTEPDIAHADTMKVPALQDTTEDDIPF